MASGREDRQPQFTSSHYEIPSWQVPWSKPWYQSVAGGIPTNQRKYNSRGHDLDCNCPRCEEDLETAFTPQVVHNTDDILNASRVNTEAEDTYFASGSQQGASQATEQKPKVFLLSELAEVKPNESSSTVVPPQAASDETNRTRPEPSNSCSFPSVEAVMGSVGSMRALAAISDRTKDIQSRVEQLSKESSLQEYLTVRGLLVSCVEQLNRIDSTEVRWLEIAKNISLEAIRNLLAQVEEKLKGRVDLDQD